MKKSATLLTVLVAGTVALSASASVFADSSADTGESGTVQCMHGRHMQAKSPEELTENFAVMVESGELTQEEADARLAKMEKKAVKTKSVQRGTRWNKAEDDTVNA